MKSLNTASFFNNVAFGIGQILLWGGSLFLLAVLAEPIMKETGWPHQWVYGSLSLAMLVSGLLAPAIGRRINREDRNTVLLYSGIVMGAGLFLVAVSNHIVFFLCGWAVIGIGMAMGLYDALFASLGKRHGRSAGMAITQVTLISGFCSTVVWPLLSVLLEHHGWRTACMIYGAILIVVIFPMHKWALRSSKEIMEEAPGDSNENTSPQKDISSGTYYLLLTSFTISSILMTGIYVHLIDILTNKNISLKEAVGIGALLGPSQVGTRILEIVLPKRSPVKTAILASLAVFLGLSLLMLSPAIAIAGVIIFSMGNAMRSILRGTLPLWIYGSGSYASILGRLARPPLIAQAFTPFAAGYLIRNFGTAVFLQVLCVLALVNVALSFAIRGSLKGGRRKA
jgi:MFS family permease